MKSIVKTGKTIEEALKEALEELGLQKEDVSIKVLEQPSKGLFGIIGTKEAKVKVTATNDPVEIIDNFLNSLFINMGVNARTRIKRERNNIYIDLECKRDSDMGIIIGKRGKTLDAIQYIVSLVVNKDRKNYIRVLIDVENYRKKREETLIRLAKKMAQKSKTLGKTIRLEPMNPYERRIIHSALQDDPSVETHSEGEEPYRRVVIQLK